MIWCVAAGCKSNTRIKSTTGNISFYKRSFKNKVALGSTGYFRGNSFLPVAFYTNS